VTHHVDVVVDVPKAILDHSVNHLRVSEPRTVPRLGQVVRDVTHALKASSHDNTLVSEHDALCTIHDGLHARGADLVDGGAHSGLGQLGSERSLASRSLTDVGRHHVAHQCLVDLSGLDACKRRFDKRRRIDWQTLGPDQWYVVHSLHERVCVAVVYICMAVYVLLCLCVYACVMHISVLTGSLQRFGDCDAAEGRPVDTSERTTHAADRRAGRTDNHHVLQ
jgi:hypothetical protein